MIEKIDIDTAMLDFTGEHVVLLKTAIKLVGIKLNEVIDAVNKIENLLSDFGQIDIEDWEKRGLVK